jgi:hypothetical protein
MWRFEMGSILEKVIQINRKHSELHKDKTYNIFSVLQIQSKEVLTCRMIADFLNPRGAHGSGTEYLKLFLNNILGINEIDDNDLKWAVVTAEYVIDEERRIDIVIEVCKHFIPIEVKIYAGEQQSQCYDYYKFAREKDINAKVYYLTIDGHSPTEYSTSGSGGKIPESDIVCLSFKQDILNWLKSCKTVDNSEMLSILNQFIQSIENLVGYNSERMTEMISDEIIKSDESLRAGIQIADSISVAKAKVMYLMFEEFEKQLEAVAIKNNWSREHIFNWYEYKDMANENFYKEYSTYPGINYVVNNAKLNNGYQLWFRIEVENNLFAGFCVFNPNAHSENGKGEQVNAFDDDTKTTLNTYLNTAENEHSEWWATWWYLPTGEKKPKDSVPNFKTMNDFAISLADDNKRKAFVKECIEQIETTVKRVFLRHS